MTGNEFSDSQLPPDSVADKRSKLTDLLQLVAAGRLNVEAALSQLEQTVPASASPATLELDFDRRTRCGFPEAIYAQGKPAEVLVAAFRQLQERGEVCLATRVSAEQAAVVQQVFPAVIYHPGGRTLRLMTTDNPPARQTAKVIVATAGTTDAGVADEAAETLRWMGFEPQLIYDIGVAGPHRLLKRVPELQAARAIVVVAGMEGALPSALAGWVGCPVVAVPTSVGYGANLAGLSALLSMLNSCAANVCTVNIDAGFKGGFLAGLIAQEK